MTFMEGPWGSGNTAPDPPYRAEILTKGCRHRLLVANYYGWPDWGSECPDRLPPSGSAKIGLFSSCRWARGVDVAKKSSIRGLRSDH